jgi:CxxC motif-containing protein (DUF1111 family)
VLIGCMLMVCCIMCRKANTTAVADDSRFDPRLSGGAATFFDDGTGSLGTAVPGLSTHDDYIHELGDKLFGQPFVAAPAPRFGGLGPIYNNSACGNCHHNDGFGLPTFGQLSSSLLLRISIPGTDAHGGANAAPGFGGQLQNVGLLGVQPEVSVNLTYNNTTFTFADGETATMRTPNYDVQNPYIPLPAGYMISPRLGSSVFGLGLLEEVPESTILGFADPNDANNDGISGKANYVYNPYTQRTELGRFGKKANTSTLQVQVATAFQQDMGLTSYVQPKESVYGQDQYRYVTEFSGYDLPDSVVNAVTFYVKSLAVPARRNVTETAVKHGEQLFKQINCAGCHIQTMYTGVYVPIPALSGQRIHPYTDLLVHDIGAALADNRPDFLATGTEWRTQPLWGIGLFEKATGRQYYLHDGRAQTLTEAILWHGGEAQGSKDKFVQMSKADRNDLIAFLKSL